MKKVVIFDLDGTLINTLEDITDSLNYSFNYFNYDSKTYEEVKSVLGNGIPVTTSLLLKLGKKDPHYQEIIELFNKYYSKHYKVKTKPYKGLLNQLNTLKNNGYTLMVCTNKNKEKAVELVEEFFPGVFQEIIGEVPNIRHKPHPDMINSIISKYSLQKQDILYVGDTEIDYLTATNSGVNCLLVDYGFRDKETLIKKCGSIKISTLDNLYQEITKIL